MDNEELTNRQVNEIVDLALAEDTGYGDITSSTLIPAQQQGKASITVKEDAVLAGGDIAALVFHKVETSLQVSINKNDGEKLKTGDKIQRQPGEISASLEEYLGGNAELKQIITSVGIPILLPDGKMLIRGPFIRIPEVAGQYDVPIGDGDIDRWANKGWVDLREQNMARWQKRFEVMQRGQLGMRAKGSADVVREAYLHEEILWIV